jgi:hypothetical protein
MKDLTVVLEDRPGELAKLGRATGAAARSRRAKRLRQPSVG